jgi:hypothetical protein
MFKFRTLLTSVLAILGIATAGVSRMNNAVTGSAGVTLQAAQTSTLSLGNASYSPQINTIIKYVNGTGNGAFTLLWSDTSTVAASAADTVRLRGVETDAFGTAINYGGIKAIAITAASTNTNNVVIGGAADSAWVGPFGATTHTISVKPGGFFATALPNTAWPVAELTKKLKIANSGAGSTVKYTIMTFGIP